MKGAPAIVGAVGIVATVGLLAWGAREAGGLAFPLDDTYIHLAVARTLAESGTWGVNPGEHASATSSPAWTVAVATMFRVTGPAETVPIVLNLLTLLAVAWRVDGSLVDAGWSSGARLAGGLLVLVATPLPVLAALGMEHVPHLLAALLLAGVVTRRPEPGRVRQAPLAVLGGVLPMLRFEGMFEVAVATCILLFRGRRREAVALACGAAMTVGTFAAWSVANGSAPVPNSLVMKGSLGNGFVANFLTNLDEGAACVSVVLLVAVALPRGGPALDGAMLFLGTALLHLTFAGTGWYYRYEAYLLAWGTLTAFSALRDLPRSGFRAGAVALVAVGFAVRSGERTFDAVRYFAGRCVYIHDTKVEPGRSLARTAPGARIALHDIGAVAFYGRAHVVDIAGLGTDEVAHLSASRTFTGVTIDAVVAARGAVIGFATSSWMEEDPPPTWRRVGQFEWGLDAERRIEPIATYALAPGGEALARAWLTDAAAHTAGRARYVEVQGSGSAYTDPAEAPPKSVP